MIALVKIEENDKMAALQSVGRISTGFGSKMMKIK